MEAWNEVGIKDYTDGQIRIKVARLNSKALSGLDKTEKIFLAELKKEALNRGLVDVAY